ncbi:hypothetical protein [Koleobacter methoxysyntrophicus]|uniref:hypothetical protein n=1 Tax=Koleobacter methoxysyntrophicus TaxID=2751313 RepID=UPI0019D61B74|nr:hypothetical protein [Koleobacter methoxysyntrophicus]
MIIKNTPSRINREGVKNLQKGVLKKYTPNKPKYKVNKIIGRPISFPADNSFATVVPQYLSNSSLLPSAPRLMDYPGSRLWKFLLREEGLMSRT